MNRMSSLRVIWHFFLLSGIASCASSVLADENIEIGLAARRLTNQSVIVAVSASSNGRPTRVNQSNFVNRNTCGPNGSFSPLKCLNPAVIAHGSIRTLNAYNIIAGVVPFCSSFYTDDFSGVQKFSECRQALAPLLTQLFLACRYQVAIDTGTADQCEGAQVIDSRLREIAKGTSFKTRSITSIRRKMVWVFNSIKAFAGDDVASRPQGRLVNRFADEYFRAIGLDRAKDGWIERISYEGDAELSGNASTQGGAPAGSPLPGMSSAVSAANEGWIWGDKGSKRSDMVYTMPNGSEMYYRIDVWRDGSKDIYSGPVKTERGVGRPHSHTVIDERGKIVYHRTIGGMEEINKGESVPRKPFVEAKPNTRVSPELTQSRSPLTLERSLRGRVIDSGRPTGSGGGGGGGGRYGFKKDLF